MSPKVLVCAMEGNVWVCGPAATGVCYHQRPGIHPWSGLLPGTMLMSERCTEMAHPSLGYHGCHESRRASPATHELLYLTLVAQHWQAG